MWDDGDEGHGGLRFDIHIRTRSPGTRPSALGWETRGWVPDRPWVGISLLLPVTTGGSGVNTHVSRGRSSEMRRSPSLCLC